MNICKREEFLCCTFPSRDEFLRTCKMQSVVFPDPYMQYILDNPRTITSYIKMVSSAKILFEKCRMLVLEDLTIIGNAMLIRSDKKRCFKNFSCKINRKYLSISDFVKTKFWYVGEMEIDLPDFNICHMFTIKDRFDLKSVDLRGKFSYQYLQILSNGVEDVCIELREQVHYADGTSAFLEDILNVFKNAKQFYLYTDKCTIECKDINDLVLSFQNMKRVMFYGFSPEIDISVFYSKTQFNKNQCQVTIYKPHFTIAENLFIEDIIGETDVSFVPPDFKEMVI